MLTYGDAIILGLVQGLTEFLPISNSGHLVMVQHLFGLKGALGFDVFVHFGTLAAVVVYYRREVLKMAISPFFPSRAKGAR
jgi:undecaprenyl-diphosphatase